MQECIVRMAMPENCWDFPCLDDYGDYPRCRISEEQRGYNFPIHEKRMPNCPIGCFLPEGHGRLVSEKDVRWAIDDIVIEIAERIGHVPMTKDETMEYVNQLPTIVPADTAESPSPKPTDPVPIRDVYYVMTECDAKTGTVKYEPRERIEL